MEAEQLHRSANPNICPSCEQLLEDESPSLMAEIARLPSQDHPDDLLDEPSRAAPQEPKKTEAPSSEMKESKK